MLRETYGGPLCAAWKGVARGQSAEVGRGQAVKDLIQHASQFEFFPEDDGEPLEWESNRTIISFKVMSQAATNRLEGMQMKLDNLDLDLFEGNHFCMGLSLNFMRQWELYNQLLPF